ncbi:hypothetical protein [Amycolatopsis kentuckyensis]|uniref:hypothetical protein n=1 Tax=Amycolatopsis kentuckyensis TaxID=218823 RepID=UPI00142E729C|nr:hypothetical protein [Amycolatopsis kentuckyensis]
MSEPLPAIEYPCAHCGTETGSDVMTWCSAKCQQAWRVAQEVIRIRENLAKSKEVST